ncbi:MAG: PIG-L family deacetylase [bacterium]
MDKFSVFFELCFLRRQLSQRSFSQELFEIKQLPENVLIVAPHSDDEMLGCGGVMKSHCSDSSFFVYIPASGTESGQSRLEESLRAVSGFGPRVSVVSGKFPDGFLKDNQEELHEEMISLVSEHNIKTVFAPLFTEFHPDHVSCALSTLRMLKKNTIDKIYFYTTNHFFSPEIINSFHTFPGSVRDKTEMLKDYRSQQKINFKKITAMEKIYSESFHLSEFSEFFYHMKKDDSDIEKTMDSCYLFLETDFRKFGSVSRTLGILRFFKKCLSVSDSVFSHKTTPDDL